MQTGLANLPKFGIFSANEVKGPVAFGEQKTIHPGREDRIPLSDAECFLCGRMLSKVQGSNNQYTGEDVFAKWLQRKFELAHLSTHRADGSTSKYSEILIPCCVQCNGIYLSLVENRIKNAIEKGGAEKLKQLRGSDVYLWCAKIYYGLVHWEVLPRDPKTRESVTATLPDGYLEDLKFELLLMQGFRKRVMLSGLDFPFTVLVFPLYTGRDPANFFHVRFTMETPAIALQLADVGIICTLCDFGEVERWYRIEFANVVDGRTLHPDQFWELAGHLSYRSYMVPLGVQVAAMESESAVWLDLDPYVDDQRLPKASRELHEAWLQQITGAPDGLFRYDNAGSQPTTLLTPTGTLQQLAFVDFP